MAWPMLPQLPLWTVYPVLIIGLFISFFYIFVLLQDKKEYPRAKNYFPEVAFVIPARNVQQYITKCVEGIVNQVYKSKIYIVIVNDASKDKTVEVIKQLMKKYNSKFREIILLNRPKSIDKKAAAVNTGLRYVLNKLKLEIVATVDADTFIDKYILLEALGQFENDKNIAAVISPLLPYNKRSFLEKMQYVEYVMSMFFRKLLGKVNALCFTPAFAIFRTKFLREAGLYNENTWTEDFDMALKVKSHYYNISQIDSKAEFIAPETWKKLKVERVRWAHGTFQALFKDYSYMISPKYGTVGTFFLPITVLLGTLLIIVALLFVIYGAIAGLTWIAHNFVLGWKPIFEFNISFFDISVLFSDPRFILGVVAILISVFFLVFAQRYTKRKINLLYYFLFFIPYAWFLAYTNLEGLIRYIFKLKMSWGNMHSKDEKKN